jgi:ATP-dependent helicase YprA (DUF1998 family)
MNKIQVLDKGYVALLSTSMNGRQLQDIQNELFKANIDLRLINTSSATIAIKMPLFVQLNMSQYGFDIISTQASNIEAYKPDVSQLEFGSLEDREELAKYFEVTTEALLTNIQSMSLDKVDRFTAQILSPVSVYNTVVIFGSLKKWISYIKQSSLPKELEQYRETIEFVLETEWASIKKLKSIY